MECPKCGAHSISRIKTRKQFDCNSCRYRFSVTSGTVFADSHLALPKWFAAVYLLCEAKKGMSALQLKRTLGVAQKTAWYLCHRIRSAMVDPDGELLYGRCGGRRDLHRRQVGTGRGCGATAGTTRPPVVGAIQRGGKLRVRDARRRRTKADHEVLAEMVSGDADAIYTEGEPVYGDLKTTTPATNR